jgi:hypothetical protein
MVKDDILGERITKGSSGFDEWGFRNRAVPAQVDLVALGDSHTYGNNAKMEDSWPYVAAHSAGVGVYNLGLGGYGPNQYSYLLKTKALGLKPRWILCGLYLGDDFENAFLITYGKDYWSFLRKGDWGQADPDIWQGEDYDRSFKAIRTWLSKNSIFYQLLFHGPLLGNLKGALQTKRAPLNPAVATLIVPEANIEEAFRPLRIQKNLDQSDPAIREGMRITFELLQQMNTESREHGTQFAVVLIPTKESVFADYLSGRPGIHLSEVLNKVIVEEQIARSQLVDFFNKAGIAYVDALPALRREAGNHLYIRGDADMHPAKNGYRVIGQVAAKFLDSGAQR